MLGSLGFAEILVIAVVALIVIGPEKLPSVLRSVGKGMAEFRRTTNELRWQIMSSVEEKPSSPVPPPPPKPKAAVAAAPPNGEAMPPMTPRDIPPLPSATGSSDALGAIHPQGTQTPPQADAIAPETLHAPPEAAAPPQQPPAPPLPTRPTPSLRPAKGAIAQGFEADPAIKGMVDGGSESASAAPGASPTSEEGPPALRPERGDT